MISVSAIEVSWIEPSESRRKQAVFVCRSASRNADVHVCDGLTLSRDPGHSSW